MESARCARTIRKSEAAQAGRWALEGSMLRLIALMSLAANAAADSFYNVAKVECDMKNDFVAVRYLGAYNENGRALIAGTDGNGIRLWKRVEAADNDETGGRSQGEDRFDPWRQLEIAMNVEKFVMGPDENAVDPWSLVEISDGRITRLNSVQKACSLSDGTYVVEIGPSPGNTNIQGRCGAHVSAWAELYRGDKLLVRSGFEGDCFDTESTILTRVLWRAGATSPEITESPHDSFYE